jgi:hypothetical protein
MADWFRPVEDCAHPPTLYEPIVSTSEGWVGRWPRGIGGVPNSALTDTPLTGNGYIGVLLADGIADGLSPDAPAVDVWLNSNANWGCANNMASKFPGRLTEAVCSAVGLGGLSLSVPALGTNATLVAEQRISTAHLWAKQTAGDNSGAALETLTYVHPRSNLVVTNVTWHGPAPTQLDVSVWAIGEGAVPCPAQGNGVGKSRCGGPSKAGSSDGLIWAWRDASKTSSDTAFRRIRTMIAVQLPPGAASRAPSLDLGSSKGAASSSSVQLTSGQTVSIVVAMGDNLQQGNGHDALPATIAAAKAASAATVATDVKTWWRKFWAKSSVSLPQSPTVEAFWAHR